MMRLRKIFINLKNRWYDFTVKRLGPLMGKFKYRLTHNFVINIEKRKLIICRVIKIKITNRNREAVIGYFFILLWLTGFLLFTAYPLFHSLYLSFTQSFFNMEIGLSTTWVGFRNFQSVLSDSRLLPLFGQYLGKIIVSVPLIIVFSLLIAILINQPIRGKGFFRTVFFLPVVISTGPVLGELIAQGATTLPSLSRSAITATIMANFPGIVADTIVLLFNSMLFILWYAGIPILIFLAGLQKINQETYEAAAVDGASVWDTFWKITLPSIKPLISVNIIYIVVSMSLYVETGGILDLARTHMLSGTKESLLWLGYGYAAAIAWIYFILMVIVILLFVGLISIRKRRRR